MKKGTLKTVSGILASCITFESCGGNLIFDEPADDINRNIQKEPEEQALKSIAVSSTYQVGKDDLEYIAFLEQLANDIIDDEETAKLFIKDPQAYIAAHGFDRNVNINSKVTNCILALSDKEICKAAQVGDIERYIELLEQKGYIDRAFINNVNKIYAESSEAKKDLALKSLLKTPLSADGNKIDGEISAVIFSVAIIVGAVAAVWAVVVEHAVAANAVAYATALVSNTAAVTSGKGKEKETGKDIKKEKDTRNKSMKKLQDSSLLSVWKLKNHSAEKTYVVTNKLTDKIVADAIKFIRKNCNEELKNISDNDLRTFILLNLQTYEMD